MLLKRNAVTNVRVWNNSTKTILHDGWVMMTENGVYKCADEKCNPAPEQLID